MSVEEDLEPLIENPKTMAAGVLHPAKKMMKKWKYHQWGIINW